MESCQGRPNKKKEKEKDGIYYVFSSSYYTQYHTLHLLMYKDSEITWQSIIYQYSCIRYLFDNHGEIEGDLLDEIQDHECL